MDGDAAVKNIDGSPVPRNPKTPGMAKRLIDSETIHMITSLIMMEHGNEPI